MFEVIVKVMLYFCVLKRILVIQTSFIGDVILATPVLEKLHQFFPDADIDMLVRKGNESLLEAHPFLHDVIIWNKKQDKLQNLIRIILAIRNKKYDLVVNLHRFVSTGLITAFSGAKEKVGFRPNPLALFYTKAVDYNISKTGTLHECQRNLSTIAHLTDNNTVKPKLYPTAEQYTNATLLAQQNAFVTISPASVWQTKQLPTNKWVALIKKIDAEICVYILGGPDDIALGDEIMHVADRANVINLCGRLGLLASAAFMSMAKMNYVNDSAPLHLCSAMDAPVTAFFCSTVPAYGFGPLSTSALVLESKEELCCRPCGVHGHRSCPQGHFNCGNIDIAAAWPRREF